MELLLAGGGGGWRGGAMLRRVERRGAGLAVDDVAWLGRHLARTKPGLALGAGGAKGYAHVGALQVIEEAGYAIDCVGGSSIGAVVGAYVALGMGAAEIEATLRSAFTEETVAEVFKLSLSGQSTGATPCSASSPRPPARARSRRLRSRSWPCRSTSTTPARPLREGTLWEALMASTALAGMFPPREREGQRLVDGLALVPVPAGAVAADGADVTVAVNIMSRDTLDAWPGHAVPEEPPQRPGSRMLETLLEVMDVSQLDSSTRTRPRPT